MRLNGFYSLLHTGVVRHGNPITVGAVFYDFSLVFRAIGQAHVWDNIIFPGMCDSVYAVLTATTDASRYRAKTFQLFGADFVITDNFIPHLIEINSMPGLNPSTSVIANLALTLLEDIVKGICINLMGSHVRFENTGFAKYE